MTDWQYLFNVAVGLVGLGIGWWLKTLWEAMHDLQLADKELAEKVSRIEVLVAGNYVSKPEFAAFMSGFETRMASRLDRIDSKLDGKADR